MYFLSKNQLSRLAVPFFMVWILASCSRDDMEFTNRPKPEAKAPYTDGFFIITEGSYGQTSGTVHFYGYGADTVSRSVYEKENTGKVTSNAAKTSTLQFATLYNGKLYLISKINGPVIKLDAGTLKEEARYNQETSNWRSLIGIKNNEGLISAGDGVYSVDLNTLSIKNKLSSVPAVNSGDMLKQGSYIYILQNNGAKIISSSNYSFIKGFTNINRGFAVTPNGKVWASTGNRLIAIDKNLDTAGIALPVSIGSFGLDAPTRLTASVKENAVFYHSGTGIYKYVDGNAASVDQPFITITEAPFMLYGAVRYDKNKDWLVVNGIGGYGAAAGINYLLIYDASTGAPVKRIVYGNDGSAVNFSDIYFPNLSVFY